VAHNAARYATLLLVYQQMRRWMQARCFEIMVEDWVRRENPFWFLPASTSGSASLAGCLAGVEFPLLRLSLGHKLSDTSL
jgi:hypothetical protein